MNWNRLTQTEEEAALAPILLRQACDTSESNLEAAEKVGLVGVRFTRLCRHYRIITPAERKRQEWEIQWKKRHP